MSFRRMPESMSSEGGAAGVVPLFEMDTDICLQGGRYLAQAGAEAAHNKVERKRLKN